MMIYVNGQKVKKLNADSCETVIIRSRCLFCALLIIVLPACEGDNSSQQDSPVLISKNSECSVDLLQWVEVSEDYNVLDQSKLSAELQLAIEANVKKIKLSKLLNGGVDFSLSPNVFASSAGISGRSQHKALKLSQEFYQVAFTYRNTVCSIEKQIQIGLFKDPGVRKNAEEVLLQLSLAFSKLSIDNISEANSESKIDEHTSFSKSTGQPQKKKMLAVTPAASGIHEVSYNTPITIQSIKSTISVTFPSLQGVTFAKILVAPQGESIRSEFIKDGDTLSFESYRVDVLSIDLSNKTIRINISPS